MPKLTKGKAPASRRNRGAGASSSPRPTAYTEERSDQVCERIMLGETIAEICADGAMPRFEVFCRWLVDHPKFTRAYAFALRERSHRLTDCAKDIVRKLESGALKAGEAEAMLETLKSRYDKRGQ